MMTSFEILSFISDRIGGNELGYPVSMDNNISDLGIDSLDYLDLLNGLEERTNKDVPKEKAANFQTVRQIAEFFIS